MRRDEEEDDDENLTYELQLPEVNGADDSGEEDDMVEGAPVTSGPPLRRSSRTTAGKHSNPFHLPRTTVAEANEIDVTRQEALINLSRAHFALVEMLKLSN